MKFKTKEEAAEFLLHYQQEQERLKKEFILRDYKPYKKQVDFHNAGASFPERLISAGNQQGKSWLAGTKWRST